MPFDFLGKKVVLYFAVRLMAMFPLSGCRISQVHVRQQRAKLTAAYRATA